jgi:hypothetical protein
VVKKQEKFGGINTIKEFEVVGVWAAYIIFRVSIIFRDADYLRPESPSDFAAAESGTG